ncbi:hypothetical protein OROMI_024123 [Orobanche minor]
MTSPRHPPRSPSHSPRTPRHSPPHSAASPHTHTTSRNPTRCRSMAKRRVDGKKLPLDIDPVRGKLKYEHKVKLSTYLGKLAKDHVSILYDRWNHVPDKPDKEMLWQDVLANFDVSQISDIGQFRMKTLQSIGRNWRQFKTDLTGEYIYGSSKGLSPCEKYGISEDDWKEFKKIREDPTWEEKRIKKQEIAKLNKAPHTMARGGYDYVVVQEIERKLEERKKEASKSGEDVIIDPPSPPSRHQRWKLGRRTRAGGVSSEAAQDIITKIDELEAQCTQGSFTPEGRHDILAEAFGRPEHPGRVRGIGFGVGIRDYFGRSSRRAASSISDSVLEELTKKITYDVTQNLMKTFGQTLESLGAHSQQPHTDLRTPDDHHVTRVSTKGSCADDVSGPSRGKTSPVDTGRVGFYVDERPPRLVAIGRVHHGDSTLHCAPLPAHLVKVVVDEVVDGGAEVPVPTEEVSLVKEALGTFIAWPKNLVIAYFIKDIERPEPPKKYARQDDRSSHSDTLKELFSVAATLFTGPLPVPWDTASFGCGGDDVPLYISYNDLLEIIQDKQWLSLSILQFWTLYLSKLNVGTVDDDLYGYFDPQSIQNMGNKGEEASGYIASRMSDAKKQIYLGAYHHDEHWQLLVIILAKGEVVWFCSLHRKPDNRIKAVIQNAVTAYKMMGGMHTSRCKQITWIYPKCNKQSGGWECGYYVMHWMLTIVRARITEGWMEMFDDVAALPTDGIREIRTEWAKQFLEVRSRLYA